ncbi:hypothetical protein [Microbacterium kyungheense]|uniref:Uncharacterized protein n=1 Tax=Microbacterium kyungheense TaxID=1263636 RepID=A0A543EF02_9MICO|nr:hypothetical protein [Microbacterium kyungheense]TQM20165.1 hypothetical protein FB391_3299 [Microbacterium kyungheense]
MSTPTDSPHDELQSLRRRAYGPDADIHDDPVALARLQQLEEQQRAAAAPVDDEPSSFAVFEDTGALPLASDVTRDDGDDPRAREAEPAATGDVPDEPPAPQGATLSSVEGPGEQGSSRPWWRRRRVLWAGSLVLAVLLGVGLTLSVQSITSGKIATLGVDRDGEWPTQSFGDKPPGAQQFEDFHGLTVVGLSQGFGGGVDQVCLSVQSTPNGSGNIGAWGCGTVDFPAAASLIVSETAPPELRDAFPLGTALQFVLDGSQVHVYAKAPGVGGATPNTMPASSAPTDD